MNDSVLFDPDKVLPIAFSPDMGVNVDEAIAVAQVKQNIRRCLPQAVPYQLNPAVVALVCGGPSLASTEGDLVKAVWGGAKVVAVNGAYQWCIDRNIRPSAFVMIDARQFNSRFVKTPVEGCDYFLASQCHPDTFDMCRDRKTTIWHTLSFPEKEQPILDAYYFEKAAAPDQPRQNYYPVTLGTTVAIRALSLFRMLGYFRFEIFGLDSCVDGDRHHAYEQKENDNEDTFAIWTRPDGRDDLARRFICTAWQAKQGEDFIELIKARGELFRINVHGDGLIATMIRTGAEMKPEAAG